MALELNLIQSLAIAAFVSFVGSFVKSKVSVFQKYFIPSPVIGGLIAAIIIFVGYSTDTFTIKFDTTLNGILLQMFFTATGFTFSIKSLKKSGITGAKIAGIIITIAALQNVVAAIVSPIVGVNPLLGITVGSMSMSGGPGTAAAFGPTIEDLGVKGAAVAAIAASTAGLVIGSIIGGPVAKIILTRNKIETRKHISEEEIQTEFSEASKLNDSQLNGDKVLATTLLDSVIFILVAMGLGIFVVNFLNKVTGFKWPDYVGGLFVAAIITNILEAKGYHTYDKILNDVGNAALNIFLTLTVMATEIWLLLDLALPLIVLLAVQALVMMTLAIFVIFRILGKDYDATVMSAGMCGVGIGSTPNAVANMDSVIVDNGPAPIPMTILPPVVSIALSVLNPVIITFAIKLLS